MQVAILEMPASWAILAAASTSTCAEDHLEQPRGDGIGDLVGGVGGDHRYLDSLEQRLEREGGATESRSDDPDDVLVAHERVEAAVGGGGRPTVVDRDQLELAAVDAAGGVDRIHRALRTVALVLARLDCDPESEAS